MLFHPDLLSISIEFEKKKKSSIKAWESRAYVFLNEFGVNYGLIQ